MVLVDVVLVLVVVALLVYGLTTFVTRATRGTRGPDQAGPNQAGPGRWRTHHYDAKGSTRVVVQKVSSGGTHILDEHVVATIRRDDAEYDARFMTAMATARERRALFEAEADG